MNWQQWFQPQIIERGEAYAQEGAVEDLQVTATGLTATVNGRLPYQVQLEISGDELVAGHCTCPYAAKGHYCKHMAAALIVAESQRPATAQDLVARVPEQQLRAFVRRALRADAGLRRRFDRQFKPRQSAATDQLASYQQEVDALIVGATDYQGFIDYDAATDFEVEVQAFLDDEVTSLIERRQGLLAAQVLLMLLTKLEHVEIDDSDGELLLIFSGCELLLDRLDAVCDPQTEAQMVPAICDVLRQSPEIIAEPLEDWLFKHFKSPAALELKCQFVAERLAAAHQLTDQFERDWHCKHWAVLYLEVLKELNVAETQVLAFCRQELSIPEIRCTYAQLCLQRGDGEQAIQTLQAGKREDPEYLEFKRQLATTYQRLGRLTDAQHVWFELCTQPDQPDLEDFKALKATYQSAEWPPARKQLFQALRTRPRQTLAPLYANEKMLKPLLKVVLSTPGLELADRYGHLLKGRFSDQLLAKYKQEVQIMAQPTGRQYYRQVARVFDQMLTYPAGQLVIRELITKWRVLYKRRTAMARELQRFGW